MVVSWKQSLQVLLLVSVLGLKVCLGGDGYSGSCPFSSPEPYDHGRDDDDLHHGHGHGLGHQHHNYEHHISLATSKLQKEMAVEEDLKLYGLSHNHSASDISSLAGVVLFLLLEKVLRYVDTFYGEGTNAWGLHHHHHHYKSSTNLNGDLDNLNLWSIDGKNGDLLEMSSEGKVLDGVTDDCFNEEKLNQNKSLLCKVGDFAILLRLGLSISKALFLNFLSVLVALAGTVLALLLGQDPGHSSLIEGFTAGGFIYSAIACVLPEMNNWNLTFISSVNQLMSVS